MLAWLGYIFAVCLLMIINYRSTSKKDNINTFGRKLMITVLVKAIENVLHDT